MNKVIMKALLINTFQKEIRNKTLVFLFVLSIFLILLINQISVFFVSNPAMNEGFQWSNTKMSFLYEIISAWGSMLGFILGVSTIKSDMDYGVSQQIVAFPVKPPLYLACRLVGTWLIVNFYYIVTLLLALLVFALSGDQLAFSYKIFLSFGVFSLKILICITLAALLSIHFTKVIAFVSSIIIFMVMNVSNAHFAKGFAWNELGIFSTLGLIVHWILPRIDTISGLSKNLLMDKNTFTFSFLEGGHLVLSYAFLFWVTYFSLKSKDYQGGE
ncbi:MAG: hypothetical protein A2202_02960 [Bdellovibrionales bacterium RIFOXYA1_FULL_36_14]|nr:MAG: hypothetical protein A2202_02960 [Bdellovibrionales bacterium RIFOXYA1_FULL_36_14]